LERDRRLSKRLCNVVIQTCQFCQGKGRTAADGQDAIAQCRPIGIGLSRHELNPQIQLPTLYLHQGSINAIDGRSTDQADDSGHWISYLFPQAIDRLVIAHHHHHLLCVRCNKTIEFKNDSVLKVGAKTAEKSGYQLLDCQLSIHAVCPACQRSILSI
jgi:hypothetical protein